LINSFRDSIAGSEEVFLPAIPLPHSSVPPDSAVPGYPTREAGTGPVPLSLFGLEFSLGTASLDDLETVARSITSEQVGDWFSRFEQTEEVALVSTCHRVELLLLTEAPGEVARWQDVLPGGPGSWTLREGPDVVHHLFRVAAGRESLATGEAEVGLQVRTAAHSVESRHPRPVLHELLVAAADAADTVRPAASPVPSIASVATSRLLELVGRPLPRVLVVGSGTVGRQVVESLSSSARLTLVYHQRPPEEKFLRATGARAVRLERMTEELATTDAIVTAAKFGYHGLRAVDLPRDRPLVLVDLGMPRNIDPDVRELPNVRLVDLEELHSRSEGLTSVDGNDAQVERLAAHFSERLGSILLEPWIDAFRRAAEEVRRSELGIARGFLGELDPGQQLAVERLTQRLVARLLAGPTERMRALPAGPEGDLLRRFGVELLRPRSGDP
jgi:glutamyl-tRNA reductase